MNRTFTGRKEAEPALEAVDGASPNSPMCAPRCFAAVSLGYQRTPYKAADLCTRPAAGVAF